MAAPIQTKTKNIILVENGQVIKENLLLGKTSEDRLQHQSKENIANHLNSSQRTP